MTIVTAKDLEVVFYLNSPFLLILQRLISPSRLKTPEISVSSGQNIRFENFLLVQIKKDFEHVFHPIIKKIYTNN